MRAATVRGSSCGVALRLACQWCASDARSTSGPKNQSTCAGFDGRCEYAAIVAECEASSVLRKRLPSASACTCSAGYASLQCAGRVGATTSARPSSRIAVRCATKRTKSSWSGSIHAM
eukprot:1644191-Prymnesium_polylepis.2